MPSGASYWPGRVTCPDNEYNVKPGDLSLPIDRNQLTPPKMIEGTDAMVSTLFTTGVHHDLQVESRALDVAADIPGRIRLGHRRAQSAQHRNHLAANINERMRRPNRIRRDDHTLHEEVRRHEHQRDVLARPRLRLVGVDDEIVRLGAGPARILGNEAPFHPGAETRTAAAPQPGVLDGLQHLVGAHG